MAKLILCIFILWNLTTLFSTDSVTPVNDSSHDFLWLGLDTHHVEKNGDSTRVTFFTEWFDSTRVTISDSRLDSESFLQNLWASDGKIKFDCTQRNEYFLLQWWARVAQIFCFDCLVVLCYLSMIKCPHLAETWDYDFTELRLFEV